jgi:hypothetical protein
MAVAAAPYLHPKLQVVDSTIRAKVEVSALSADEMRQRARQAIAEAFAERTPLVEGEVVSKTIAGYTPNVRANGEAADERGS